MAKKKEVSILDLIEQIEDRLDIIKDKVEDKDNNDFDDDEDKD